MLAWSDWIMMEFQSLYHLMLCRLLTLQCHLFYHCWAYVWIGDTSKKYVKYDKKYVKLQNKLREESLLHMILVTDFLSLAPTIMQSTNKIYRQSNGGTSTWTHCLRLSCIAMSERWITRRHIMHCKVLNMKKPTPYRALQYPDDEKPDSISCIAMS